ncbi:MAG: arsenate reductase [Candidatus Polarisedimenticolaceae bacterium]|nr:arsenate reductase [Candidatus Polarisedimenticolaceae bacterium]
MTTLYGISNCDKVRAARKWLTSHHINYHFHDTRKKGLDEATLRSWIEQLGLDKVLNRQSTSWRQLANESKQNLSEEHAIKLMLETVTLIKRPILKHNDTLTIGFKTESYQELFS